MDFALYWRKSMGAVQEGDYRMELDHRRRVIFYGDSNTYGYDPADLADMRYSWSQRWTSIAAERLKGQFEVIPEGMNGRKLPDICSEQRYLEQLISLTGQDGILCTMLGTNDILLTIDPDAGIPIRKMENYVGHMKEHLQQRQILVIAPVPIGNSNTPDPLYRNYFSESRKMNDAFRSIALKEGVLFAEAAEWDISLAYDQVHFSVEGHRQFAERIISLLRSL